jgi:4-amino-4-deoxy-L-arabinose transferase-like glycosyltransferase
MGFLYAARVAGVVTTAVLLGAVYMFTLGVRDRFTAVCATVFLVLMPRFIANGFFAILDIPTALWWFAAAALFYLAMENRKLAWAAGLAAGLALTTKINCLLLPVVLWPWGLYFYRRKAVPAIVWSAVLMPVVFFALWPFLWADPIVNFGKYFGEKFGFVVAVYKWFGVDLATHGDALHRMLQRSAVPVLYVGKVYAGGVPWHYPLVMTAITTPPGILAAAAAGAARWLREREDAALFSFLIVNVAFWLLAFAAGLAEAYDGVRLFLNIFPFVAILAAIGVRWAWQAVAKTPIGVPGAWAVAVLFVASQAGGTLLYGPYGLSYYNRLIGGLKGAERNGFDVTFWGEPADFTMLEYINDHAAQGAKVASFPMGRLYVNNMRAFALIRLDLTPVLTEDDWDFLIIANRGGFLESRGDLKALTADAVVTRKVRGVPAAWLVEKRR